MKVNIEREEREINRGDIVHYLGKCCIVVEERYSTVCLLVNLGTGIVCERFDDINSLRRWQGISLLVKNNEAVLSRGEQEEPF